MVGHFDWKHSYLIEKNVSITFILPSRWQDGAESLGIEITRCLCFGIMTYSYNSLSRKVRNLKWPFMELVIRWLNNFRMSGGSRLNMMIALMGLTMMVVFYATGIIAFILSKAGSKSLISFVRHKQCDQIGRFIGLWATISKNGATISMAKSPKFFSNFCKGTKIFIFSSEIIFGQI